MSEIIVMPKFSDDTAGGTVGRWLKSEGESVKAGEMIAEIETDKAMLEVECHTSGILLKQLAPAGSKVRVDEPLCLIGDPSEANAPRTHALAPPPSVPLSRLESGVSSPVVASVEVAAPTPATRKRISPAARKLAATERIDTSAMEGSGPLGRVVRKDVLVAKASGNREEETFPALIPVREPISAPVSFPDDQDRFEKPSAIRGIIARRLVQAKAEIPHFYLEMEVNAGPLLALRTQLNGAVAAEGIKLSVNDLIIKASARALRLVPEVNSSWERDSIRVHGGVHVAFAVTLDDGLVTPVVRNTYAKSLAEISRETKALALKARDKRLSPAEMEGSTFCVSNLGMMGVKRFSAIVNPPNAAILAVGAVVRVPVVHGDRIVIGDRISLTLSCDHRLVDGSVGARFLGALRDSIEQPLLLVYTPNP